MHYFVITLMLQVACIVHVFRNGRNTAWVFAIALLPIVGILAYLIVEVLPGFRRDPRLRKLQSEIADKVDPERSVRAAREALAFSDTVGNRQALGDALAASGDHRAAIAEYRGAEALAHRPDPVLIMRIATAAMELDEGREARAALAQLPDTQSQSERDRRDYLAGRIAEGEGNAREALARYNEIVSRYPGDEVRCRLAALHLSLGDKAAARRVLEEVELRTRQMAPVLLRENREMYAWAKRTLAEL
jgi:hypothetical protein